MLSLRHLPPPTLLTFAACCPDLHARPGCRPFVVVVGWCTGHPFTLDFDPFSTVVLTLSVMHANFVTSDARSHWLMVRSSVAGIHLGGMGAAATSMLEQHC